VVLEGLAQIGVPYVWGGASPETGFDCSGLVMWLWARHGVALPHFAASQYHLGPLVAKSDLRIGDLVFFHKLGHVGIYIGHGYVLHAPHTGATVEIESFDIPWFQDTYVGATRPGPA
jgi:peptidoglycan DL-endopeptidase CwlO